MNCKHILCIGDIHFGAPNNENILNELQLFKTYAESHEIDMIELNGDYFDRKMQLNEKGTLDGLEFFKYLVELAKRKNAAIRVIEGTMSHDMLQPEIFKNFILDDNGNPIIDYKFFPTITVENIFGINILYVPEEYPLNINEYYAPYQKNQYTLMFSHGTWDFINFGKTIDNNLNDRNTAPVFKCEEWLPALKDGLCVSGHIHDRHIYKDKTGVKVIYPGAYSAWSFDHPSKRGFIYLTLDTDTKKVTYEIVDNTLSRTYCNFDLKDTGLDASTATVEEIENAVNKAKEHCDYLKLDISYYTPEKQELLKQMYKGNKNILIRNDDSNTILIAKENKSAFLAKYDYLLSGAMSTEQVIQRFIKEEQNKDISLEDIVDVITEKNNNKEDQ